MYYEINVSKNGLHYFATAERSITSLTQAEGLYMVFKEKFPESEGYQISVTQWNKVGKPMDMSDIIIA